MEKVIYLVRDEEDVLTSYYHYLYTRRSESVSLPSLIRGEVDSFGSWSKHAVRWSRGKCQQKYVLRYEDLLDDTKTEVKKLLHFLNWGVADDKIKEAVRLASFQNLKRLEQKYGGVNTPIKPGGDSSKTDFFRKGQSGDWMQTFTESELMEFWRLHRDGMQQYKYS